VPHSELLAIPFAALVHQERYLIEKHPVITTPSLAFLVTAAEEGDSLLDTEGVSALIVADPTIESGRYSTLPSLRFARRGVEKLEYLYRGRAEILTGTEATYDRVLKALPIVRVFSYAGHAVPSPPIGEPGLVLASERGTDGAEILTAKSLSGAPLRQLELVVLAACSSGPVNYPESNEITGLAMAFLAQGAHQVISTLWDVDDQAAEDLSFHVQRHRNRQNGRVDLALQAAQLSLLRGHSPRFHHPIYWASFQLHMGKLPTGPSKPLEASSSSLHPPNLGKELSP
jgi:CHAT domain-containing protein